METSRQKHSPFRLRAKIHNRKYMSDEVAMIAALTDRIADLSGIRTMERCDDGFPFQIGVYLNREPSDRVRKKEPLPLLYSLDCNGVMVNGLDRWARHDVVSRGWGKPIFDQILIFLPRDNKELDVVWKILQRAYNNLHTSAAKESGPGSASTWNFPKSSRRALHRRSKENACI